MAVAEELPTPMPNRGALLGVGELGGACTNPQARRGRQEDSLESYRRPEQH